MTHQRGKSVLLTEEAGVGFFGAKMNTTGSGVIGGRAIAKAKMTQIKVTRKDGTVVIYGPFKLWLYAAKAKFLNFFKRSK